MSAFLCTDEHISVLAYYAFARAKVRPFGCALEERGLTDAEVIARRLHAENVRSVNHRYREDGCPPFAYSWAAARKVPSIPAVQIIKAAKCYAYQACEHDGWESSDAKRVVDLIIEHAILDLPGYSEAPWGAPELRLAAGA